MNVRLIMIIISILALLLVGGFAVWVWLSGATKKQEVQGASTSASQDDLIRQLEQNVFGDVTR